MSDPDDLTHFLLALVLANVTEGALSGAWYVVAFMIVALTILGWSRERLSARLRDEEEGPG